MDGHIQAAIITMFNKVSQPTILIFRVGQLGDTLVSMPAIHLIRSRFPQHKMVLLTDQHGNKNGYVSSWDILEPTGWFDEVIFYHPSKSIIGNTINLITLYFRLTHLKPEHVFDLSPRRSTQQSARDRFFYTRIISTANYHQSITVPAPSRLTTGELPYMTPEWQRLLNVARDPESNIDDTPFELPLPDRSILEAQAVFEACQLSEDTPIIAIGPGSKMQAKRWPLENYSALGKQLLQKKSDLRLVVLGGNEDAVIGDTLCRDWGKRSHNLAGKLSIYGSAAALKKCACYVGNDTGTMHLAAMTGVPCVAIFSARDYPGKWAPYGKRHKIIRTDCSCGGCMLEVCTDDNACLRQLSVDLVYNAVEEILS